VGSIAKNAFLAMINKLAKFQAGLRNYHFVFCRHCKERWFHKGTGADQHEITTSVDFCNECRSNKRKHRDKFNWRNDTDPLRPAPDPGAQQSESLDDEGPPGFEASEAERRQLPKLADTEEMLVSRAIPVLQVVDVHEPNLTQLCDNENALLALATVQCNVTQADHEEHGEESGNDSEEEIIGPDQGDGNRRPIYNIHRFKWPV
jgi:hypothetical protein